MKSFAGGMVVFALVAVLVAGGQEEKVPSSLPADARNAHCVSNRGPLRPNPLIKLPVGAIKPGGWLLKQLQLQGEGFVGHLPEISKFLKKDGNAWLSPDGEGHSNWEELPYWLKGFGDMAYLLDDEKLIAEAKVWIVGALHSQREDGYFGPRANLTVIKTDDGPKPDLWPNMVMLNALQSYYEWTTMGSAGFRPAGTVLQSQPTGGPEARTPPIENRKSDIENDGDLRVIRLMQRYFRWQLDYPDKDFLLPFWQQQRAADNLASVYWLYNRTGEAWLLELAQKIHRHTANWTDGIANWHGVNISQSFRGPAVYYQQSGDEKHLRATYRNYDTVMNEYGQVPGGMFGADENCRKGFTDPRQAAETCTMVEFMYSFEQLLTITGDPLWADRCEDVAFNSLPASMTADLKALRYLTSPNMISSDARSKAPGYENGGAMQLFDPRTHRCCQHNVAHGWPYFTEHLWMATQDGGLAAVMYAPCEVGGRVLDESSDPHASVGVRIAVETQYPFTEFVQFTISTPRPIRFPLYLREPGWLAQEPQATLVGRAQPADAPATESVGDVLPAVSCGLPNAVPPPTEGIRPDERRAAWRKIVRTWRDGDVVKLHLPPRARAVRWPKNHDSVSIERGPLTYALDVGERLEKVRPDDPWPAFEARPTKAWNYGLVEPEREVSQMTIEMRPRLGHEQPFAPADVPIRLKLHGRRIPNWQADYLGLVGLLQSGPAKSAEPIEEITLIPMGAARLRIAQFPIASDAADANAWTPPPKPKQSTPAAASHCWEEDTLTALDDGLEPQDSNDYNIPRFTWWPKRGSAEWVQYNFEQPRTVSKVAVFWFDDSGRGRCRTPASWKLRYKPVGAAGGEQWREVKLTQAAQSDAYPTKRDQYNQVAFESIETTALRIEVQLKPEFSGGILEWRVE